MQEFITQCYSKPLSREILYVTVYGGGGGAGGGGDGGGGGGGGGGAENWDTASGAGGP